MSLVTFKFSNQIEHTLTLNEGFLEYLAGMDPSVEWDVRGIAGNNSQKINELRASRKEKLKKIAQKDVFRQKVQSFVDDAKSIFNAFLGNNREEINQYISGKDFYFIIGPPRTGGTYVYTQVSEAFNWPWDRLMRTITHDSMPHDDFLSGVDHSYGNIAWRIPGRIANIMFQLSCFIEYARREAPDSEAFVLKNMSLCHALNLLDRLFEDKAHYLVTVRHPAAMSASRAESWQNQENTIDFRKDCFDVWFTVYAELLRDGKPTGDLNFLEFGNPMDEWLDKLHKNRGGTNRSGTVKATDRDYDKEFWKRDEFQEKLNWIEDFYSLYGFEFPMPTEIK